MRGVFYDDSLVFDTINAAYGHFKYSWVMRYPDIIHRMKDGKIIIIL